MQEDIFFNKTLRNLSKLSTHPILVKKYRHKLREAIFRVANGFFNRRLLASYRKLEKENLIEGVDVALSLGDACQAAHYLQKFGLRSFASPFDWMKRYGLGEVMQLLDSDFCGFFENISERVGFDCGNDCRYVTDVKNGMVSIHAFRKDESIEAQYPLFIKTMKRRFNRLKQSIKDSNHILFLTTRHRDHEGFKEFLNFMKGYHAARYTLLNIHNDTSKSMLSPASKTAVQVGDGLEIIEYSFNNTFPSYENLLANFNAFNNEGASAGGGGGAIHLALSPALDTRDRRIEESLHGIDSLPSRPGFSNNPPSLKSQKTYTHIESKIPKNPKDPPPIHLKIPNKGLMNFNIRLDRFYEGHGGLAGNFMRWSEIMPLIVPREKGLEEANRPHKAIMFDDEFLAQIEAQNRGLETK